MSRNTHPSAEAGFTLVELMITVVIAGLLVLLAAPSFHKMILMQRLRGVNAQLITDLQYARSEAVARGDFLRINLGKDDTQTCYTLYTATSDDAASRCDCLVGAGNTNTCPASSVEIKTINLPRSAGVSLTWPATQESSFAYEPVRGGLYATPSAMASSPVVQVQLEARIDDDRRFRTTVVQSGRASVCAPNATVMGGPAC